MSLVVGGTNLGSPITAAQALRDVARLGGDYPTLYALLDFDEPYRPTIAETLALKASARQALSTSRASLPPRAVRLLEALAE